MTWKKMMKLKKTFLAFSLLLALPALAQIPAPSVPPSVPYGIGDAGRETEKPRPLTPPPAPAPDIERQEIEGLTLPQGKTLHVKEFTLETDAPPPFAEATWRAALLPYQGRDLTLGEIEAAASKITELYRANGYPVARVYVPRQDAQDGVVKLQVLLGRYGAVRIHNQSLLADGWALAPFKKLPPGEVIETAALERAMLTVYDLPGAQMPKIALLPGEAAGTSDLEIDIPAGKRWSAYALFDNHGSRYTGKNRLTAGVSWNTPLGIGDRLSADYMQSEKSDLLYGRLAYAFPLGHDGLRAEIAVSKTTYELGDRFRDLEYGGKSRQWEARLEYPLIRARAADVRIRAGFARKKMFDDFDGIHLNDKSANVSTLGVAFQGWTQTGYGKAELTLTQGQLAFRDGNEKSIDKSGIDTQGRYKKLNLDLGGSVSLTQNLSLDAAFAGQYALSHKNLDGSEQMNLAGPNGLRAYRESITGDNGWRLDTALRYQLPVVAGVAHQAIVFVGTGRVHDSDTGWNPDATKNVRRSDAGIGYQAQKGFAFARLQVARALNSVDWQSRTRLLLMVGANY
jgi:hemolysin activation/secretion protein